MNKEKSMKKRIGYVFLSIICLFLTLSCEIGLGPSVDMQAPEITVNTPERNSYINQTVTVSGIATDNIEVTKVLVQIIETNQQYKFENSEWYKLENEDWQIYESAQYSEFENGINWSVTIPLVNANSGENYTITAQAFDYYGNEGKNSIDERSVTIDITNPIVSLIEPAVESNYTVAEENFNEYTLKNNSILSKLHNGDITVSGSQKEDAKLSLLNVYIDSEKTIALPEKTKEISNYLVKKQITGTNLRNWETVITKEEISEEYQTGKHLLRLVTESYDVAGNIERKVQGWFTYWNEADIPWISADFGGETLESKKDIYPGTKLQGQAYDDDGLKNIDIQAFYSDGTKIEDKCIQIDLEKEGYPTYYAWSIKSIEKSGVFYIKAICVDKNGVSSSETYRYMSVTDINPPSIEIETPVKNTQIPIKGNGDIVFKGLVSDNDSVAYLKLVRLAGGNEETAIKYFRDTFEDWNKATAEGTLIEDGETKNNKIYLLDLEDKGFENNLHNYAFEKVLNLFTDLGINGNEEKLSTQTFILMAIDGTGSSTIEMLSYTGDTQNPAIEFTSIYLNGKWENFSEGLEISSINGKTKLKGTWEEDSDKYNPVKISWDGANNGKLINVIMKDDNTWETEEFTPPENFSTAIISAEMEDWGGNKGKSSVGFTVNNEKLQLIRITSDEDKVYKSADTIYIKMEFNKKSTFKDGYPTLILNIGDSTNPKIAEYDSGNGSNTHIYKYTVQEGDNTDCLNVVGINSTGITWTDGTDNLSINNIPSSGPTSLAGGRTIKIDTKLPELKEIKINKTSGSFKKDTEIFFIATFSETVNFSDITKLKLKLNAAENLYTENGNGSSSGTSVTFKYKVGDNHTANPLKIESFDLNGCVITDNAGNVASVSYSKQTNIVIDTTKPEKPEITGLTKTYCYDNNGLSFNITFKESTGTKEYSIDNGISWKEYTGQVTLTDNGEYNITARQTDIAGNVSDSLDSKKVTIDKGYMLTSIKSGSADGTYKEGESISIVLKFRKTVKIDGNKQLILNSGTNAKAVLDGLDYGNELKFKYTVGEADTTTKLDITDIDATFTIYNPLSEENGNIVTNFVDMTKLTDGNKFIDNSNIEIVNNKPVVKAVSLNNSGNQLTITFDCNINKNSGNIKIEQEDNYIAPAVLDVTTFNNLKSKKKTSNNNKKIVDFYTSGTNGSDANGNSDLTEKYILNFDVETSDTTLIEILKASDADKVIVPINSSYVTTNGTDVIVSLTDSYNLPVKGTSYKVTFDEGIVINNKSIKNEEYNNGKGSINYNGVENPVIRIEKKNESLNEGKVEQPKKASVKIDCQTPDVEYEYSLQRKTNSMDSYAGTKITKKNSNWDNNVTQPTSSSFEIGNDDTNKGYIYHISATAKKDNKYATAHEYAYRSVYYLTKPDTDNTELQGVKRVGNDYPQLWIRGGDWTSGGNSTPGFPVSWNTAEFTKVRAMTQDGADNNWYYITWQINTNAYLQPLRGDLPEDISEGPTVWCWGMQGPVPTGLENYILYPGQAISISGDKDYKAGNMSFYYKHCEYRDGDKVKQGKKDYTDDENPITEPEPPKPPIEVPSEGTTSILNKEVEFKDVGNWGKCLQLDLKNTNVTIKEKTLIFIEFDKNMTGGNFKDGSWGNNIFTFENIKKSNTKNIYAYEVPSDNVNTIQNVIKGNRLYFQPSTDVTVKSIRVYNPN